MIFDLLDKLIGSPTGVVGAVLITVLAVHIFRLVMETAVTFPTERFIILLEIILLAVIILTLYKRVYEDALKGEQSTAQYILFAVLIGAGFGSGVLYLIDKRS